MRLGAIDSWQSRAFLISQAATNPPVADGASFNGVSLSPAGARQPGSIAVMNAHAWRVGTANRTAAPLLAMHAF
jgi:hypothetical protein